MNRLFCCLLLLLALPIRAQTTTTPAPLLRFFAVPWVEQLQSWHTARSNAAFAFRRGTARGHSGGGLAVEMMPSPNVAVGLGLSVTELGGEYDGTYRVETTGFSGGQLNQQEVRYAVRRHLDLTYLRTPFYLKLTPHLVGPLRAYGLGGLEAALLLSTRNDAATEDDTGHSYADEYDGIDAALLAGAGLEWWFNANTAVFVGVRFRYGFWNVQTDRPPHPDENKLYGAGTSIITFAEVAPYDTVYPLRNRSFGLETGVKFGPRTPRLRSRPSTPEAPRRPTTPLQTM